MAVALPELVDLTAFAAVLLLIGLLIATAWTFERLADALDVSILGVHPFAGIAAAIRHYVVAGINEGIASLEHVARDLWHWSEWALSEMIAGTKAFAHSVEASISWLQHHHVFTVAKALVDPVSAAAAAAHALATEAKAAVKGLETSIKKEYARADAAVLQTARRDMAGLKETILAEHLHAFTALEADVRQVAGDAVAGVQKVENTITNVTQEVTKVITEALPEAVAALPAEITAAEAAAAGEIAHLPGASLDEIERLLRSRELGTLAGLLGAIPLTMAAVRLLEAEAGLDSAQCRSKVKGICGVDPGRWAHLLEGLAFEFAWPGLEEFADGLAAIVPEVTEAITAFAGIG